MKPWKWTDHLRHDSKSVIDQSACSPFPNGTIRLYRIGTWENPKSKRYAVSLNYKKSSWEYSDDQIMAATSHLDNFRSDGKFCFTARSLAEAKRKAPAALRKALLHVMKRHEEQYKQMLKGCFQ